MAVSDLKAMEMAAYGQVIIYIARCHEGIKGNKQMIASLGNKLLLGTPFPGRRFPSLLASTDFSGAQVSGCVLCNAADHQQSACALQLTRSRESGNQPPQTSLENLQEIQ